MAISLVRIMLSGGIAAVKLDSLGNFLNVDMNRLGLGIGMYKLLGLRYVPPCKNSVGYTCKIGWSNCR